MIKLLTLAARLMPRLMRRPYHLDRAAKRREWMELDRLA
jgi:hypothetical protein